MRKLYNKVIAERQGFSDYIQNAVEARAAEGFQSIRVLANRKTDDRNAELLIVGDIGENYWGEAISGKEVLSFLREHDGEDVDVIIDCPGGDVYDGMVMMNAFLTHNGGVNGKIMGLCFSAASYAALGCSKLEAYETSNFGIHPSWSMTMGNQYAHQDTINWLDTIDKSIINVYAKRTGMTEEEVTALFLGDDNDGTIMTASEAYEHGFIDGIIELEQRERPQRNDEHDDDGDDMDDVVEHEDSAAKKVQNSAPAPTEKAPEEQVKEARARDHARAKKMAAEKLSRLGHSAYAGNISDRVKAIADSIRQKK